MKGYIFKVEKDELVCTKKAANGSTTFVGENAISRLSTIDALKFKKAKVTTSGIVLEGNNIRVYINDSVLFTDKNYQNCLYNNMKRINKAIGKYNKKANKEKNVTAGIVTGFATVGLLAAIGILVSTGNLKNESKIDSEVVEELRDDFEIELENIEKINLDNDDMQFSQVIETQNSKVEDNEIKKKDEFNTSDNNITTEELLNQLEKESNYDLVNLSFNDEFDQVKYDHVFNEYYDMVIERAPRWGISTNLVLSFISQESGGYVDNLMQIQWSSWHDQPIKVFNFEKNEYEKIVLTENPENYTNKGITQFISKEDLLNPKTNISIGCIILRYSFDQMDHNMTAAIQAYNFGVENMKKVLNAAANDKGCTVDDLLRNQSDTSFLDYRDVISVGDPNYVEHTLRYLQDPKEEISIRYIDEFGEPQETSVLINNDQTKKKL